MIDRTSSQEKPPNAERLRAMVIDDSEIVRRTLSMKLRDASYEVVELSSAIGATREILRQKVDVVLLDISMPGLSGDRFVSVLRETPRLEGLIVVIVSGENEARLSELRRSSKADAVLSKAQIDGDLLPMLTRLLRRSSAGPKSAR